MEKYYQLVIFFSIFLLPVRAEEEPKVHKDKTETDNVDFFHHRFCNQSTSCADFDLTHRDLRYQNCLCDKQCSQYGDCCEDSEYSNSKTNNYTCNTIAEGESVYMKSTCSSAWQRSSATILRYCENTTSFDGTKNYGPLLPLFIPVTSKVNNVTYRNLFCALCNNVMIFNFWKVGVWTSNKSILNDSTINWSTLLADYSDNISINAIIPENLVSNVRYCVSDVIDSCPPSRNGTILTCPGYVSYVYSGKKTFKNMECLRCNQPESSLVTDDDTDICTHPRIQHRTLNLEPFMVKNIDAFSDADQFCEEIPNRNSAHQILCNSEAEESAETNECASADMCVIQKTFHIDKDSEVEIVDDSTIFLKSLKLKLTNTAEGLHEWIRLNETTVFVCGFKSTVIHSRNTFLNDLNSWLSQTLTILSVVCLFLHLLVFMQLPQLWNTPGKSLAAYSLSMLIAFLCLGVGEKLKICTPAAIILHYTLLSCFSWMLLMSHNCWRSTYYAVTRLRATGDRNSKKFTLYCTIAHTVPLLIVGTGVFLEYSSAKFIKCQWKPDYGRNGVCFLGSTRAFLSFFVIPSSVLFAANNFFFAHTAYLIYGSQRHNTLGTQERVNFKLYLRLALIMGLTWTLGTLYTITDSTVVQLFFNFFNMSQGVFIFIAFTTKKKNLKMLLTKYQNCKCVATVLRRFVGADHRMDRADPATTYFSIDRSVIS